MPKRIIRQRVLKTTAIPESLEPPWTEDSHILADIVHRVRFVNHSRFWINHATGDVWLARITLVPEEYVEVLRIEWERLA